MNSTFLISKNYYRVLCVKNAIMVVEGGKNKDAKKTAKFEL